MLFWHSLGPNPVRKFASHSHCLFPISQDPAKYICSDILEFVTDGVKQKMESLLESAQELCSLVMGEMRMSGLLVVFESKLPHVATVNSSSICSEVDIGERRSCIVKVFKHNLPTVGRSDFNVGAASDLEIWRWRIEGVQGEERQPASHWACVRVACTWSFQRPRADCE